MKAPFPERNADFIRRWRRWTQMMRRYGPSSPEKIGGNLRNLRMKNLLLIESALSGSHPCHPCHPQLESPGVPCERSILQRNQGGLF